MKSVDKRSSESELQVSNQSRIYRSGQCVRHTGLIFALIDFLSQLSNKSGVLLSMTLQDQLVNEHRRPRIPYRLCQFIWSTRSHHHNQFPKRFKNYAADTLVDNQEVNIVVLLLGMPMSVLVKRGSALLLHHISQVF